MKAIYKLDNKINIDNIFLRHNILKFKDIINISIYKYIFRIYNKHYLHSSICSSYLPTFLIPKIIFYHEKFSIRYKCACLWNSLNTTILSLMNLNTFTIHIKNILLNNYI